MKFPRTTTGFSSWQWRSPVGQALHQTQLAVVWWWEASEGLHATGLLGCLGREEKAWTSTCYALPIKVLANQ